MKSKKWDKRFLELAQTVAQWSKDPSTKVGAVIAKGNRIISLGYNGFAAGVNDDPDRYDDRVFKYAAVIHAEENALLFSQQDLEKCTIYTWPMPPCAGCAAKIIQAGIRRVVTTGVTDDQLKERWSSSFGVAWQMYEDAGVELEAYVLPGD